MSKPKLTVIYTMKIRVTYRVNKVETLDIDIGESNLDDVLYFLNDPEGDGEFELECRLPDDAIVEYDCDENGVLEARQIPRP